MTDYRSPKRTLWTLDIETMPTEVPVSIIKKNLNNLIPKMRRGTGKEKTLLQEYQDSISFASFSTSKFSSEIESRLYSEISIYDIRPEVIQEYISKLRTAMQGSALNKLFGKVICWAIYDGDKLSSSLDRTTEQDLLTALIREMGPLDFYECRTFNGERFDFPFIVFRMFVNNLPASAKALQYRIREHQDLFWIFNDRYDKSNWISLKDACEIMSIPHTLSDNFNFEEAWANEDFEQIKEKCENDVINLHALATKLESSK